MIEGLQYDKKSLLCFKDEKKVSWKELAKDCVAFANTRGGTLAFGIEDAAEEPPAHQTIPPQLSNLVQKNISNHTIAVGITPELITHPNGGQILHLRIYPSRQSLACTTDGRYYYRVGDQSKPVMPDELPRLLAEKDMFIWETQTTRKIPRENIDPEKLSAFINSIKSSSRVSTFVREKTAPEILDHYLMASGPHLTNLGVLWLGLRQDRAQLRHAPVIQFIKYDARGNKVRKQLWDDYSKNPLELIEAVWHEIPDWREFTEFPDGIFRKEIPHYDEVVIRELLANALVHRPYTTAGDIFINLHPDYLEIHNPGLFPLGVTPSNILHQSIRRNDHLAKVFYDLKLMEREGSGYDKIYESLLSQAKSLPEPKEENDRICVTVRRTILKPEILDFLAKAEQELVLSQRERITLALIAQHQSLTALEFSHILDLKVDDDGLRSWLGQLTSTDIVKAKGKTRGTTYFINSELLRSLNFSGPTTLKKIEPHRLRELILSDLQIYGPSPNSPTSLTEIHQRIGLEIPRRQIKQILDTFRDQKIVDTHGRLRHMKYFLTPQGLASLKEKSP